jgi:hypothetical protein
MTGQREVVGRWVTAGLAVLAPPAVAQDAPARTALPPWRLQLAFDGSWYGNASSSSGVQSDPAWSTSARASLSRERTFDRGAWSLGGYGGIFYYPQVENLTQATYGASFDLAWAPSPRTQLHVAQAYDRSNTLQFRAADAESVPLPTSALDTATSRFDFTHGLSRRWQFGAYGSFSWRRFDDPALTGGEEVFGSGQLSRRVGRHDQVYAAYGYSSAWFALTRTGTHVLLAGAQRQKDKGVSLDLGGGAGYVESVARWYPAGRVGLAARGRRTSLALSYNRDFGQTFGYGRESISDILAATFGWAAGRRVDLSAGYAFGYRRDPAAPGQTIESHLASAGIGWEVTRDLGFAATCSWERNETSGLDVVDRSRVAATLSYGRRWK